MGSRSLCVNLTMHRSSTLLFNQLTVVETMTLTLCWNDRALAKRLNVFLWHMENTTDGILFVRRYIAATVTLRVPKYIYLYSYIVIIIIIIINLYGAYIIRNLSLATQQNRIIKHNRQQGHAKVIIWTRDNRRFTGEMQFGIIRSSFETLGAATEKACLSKLRLVLETISSCEMGDLSFLWIFERCRRLAK